MLRPAVTMLASAWLLACSAPGSGVSADSRISAPASPQTPLTRSATMDDDEIIRMDRSGCGFACPAYRLSFFRDGTVRFTGHAHTAVRGEQQVRIDDAALAGLLRELQAQLPAMARRYTPDSPDCGQMFTDQATTRLSARLQQGIVSSERYGGCPAAPKALADLEKKVDAVAGSDRWVSKSPTY